jgi:hypothetical protein
MDEDEFETFMIENKLSQYWKTYTSGKKLFKTGRGLLIGGGSALLGGAALTGISYSAANGSLLGALIFAPVFIIGIGVIIVGAAILSVSLPFLITGSVKRNVFIDTYNEQCAGRNPSEVSENVLSWRLQPMANGLSFTLNF